MGGRPLATLQGRSQEVREREGNDADRRNGTEVFVTSAVGVVLLFVFLFFRPVACLFVW